MNVTWVRSRQGKELQSASYRPLLRSQTILAYDEIRIYEIIRGMMISGTTNLIYDVIAHSAFVLRMEVYWFVIGIRKGGTFSGHITDPRRRIYAR